MNTQQNKIDTAASQAQAAVSDPDVLSSQDWSALLSSAASSGATVSGVSSAAAASSNSSPSWLLILGILLLLLGLAGIGFFVYLQFFSGPKGPKKGRGGPDAGNDGEPTDFVDISSSSDGIQHREYDSDGETRSFDSIRPAGTVPYIPAAPRAPQPEVTTTPEPAEQPAPAPAPQPAEQPAPQPQSETPLPAVPTGGLEPHPKAQAEPVRDSKDFDWEKFFNDNQ